MIVDVLVISVILISAIISFLRGFIREILTIFGIGGGIIAAYIGGPMFIPTVQGWLGVDPKAEEPQKLMDMVPMTMIADIMAYGGLFIVFVIILSIISHFIAEGAKNIGLGALDRTLGVVFGIARGVVLLGLLYLPVYYLVDEKQKEEWKWFKDSKSFIYLETTAEVIAGFIPKGTEENIHQELEKPENSLAREALENMDLLKKNEDSEGDQNPQPDDSQETQKNTDGYPEEFRNKMDELIELNNIIPQAGGYNE
ncbi:MAG: CvpA family protein [Alphaproteobacteria bacterium]|nr:CvpA family protein [Alphaproteobacteria bacterium]